MHSGVGIFVGLGVGPIPTYIHINILQGYG